MPAYAPCAKKQKRTRAPHIMQQTKVQFSSHEMELMRDSDWILTKNRIIQKVAEGMGSLAERMKAEIRANSSQLPGVITGSNAKISRGENYQGLPYLMLDYPRLFGKDDIFAIRTFFWWGRFCSITLHVKGLYRTSVCEKISSLTALADHTFYVSTQGDEWNHNITSAGYERITDTSSKNFALQLFHSPFTKFSAKVELTQWDEMEEKLYKLFCVLLKLV